MANAINYEFAAQVLAEASFAKTDKEIYDRHGVSKRTFANWKAALATDATLAHYYTVKIKALEDNWGHFASKAVIDSMNFISRAAKTADAKNPEVIKAMAEAAKVVAEAALSLKYINSRLALNAERDSSLGKQDESNRQDDASPSRTTN